MVWRAFDPPLAGLWPPYGGLVSGGLVTGGLVSRRACGRRANVRTPGKCLVGEMSGFPSYYSRRSQRPNRLFILANMVENVNCGQWNLNMPKYNPQIALPLDDSGPPPKAWFPGLTRVHNPNGISISLDVCTGLTLVTNTNRQTTLQR